MNRVIYFNAIEERLSVLSSRIGSRGKLNILDYHGHAENFYQSLLNEIYGWSVANENSIKQNIEAIDLIDHENKFVIQVSATATTEKIEYSLSKENIQAYQKEGYRFKFISIVKDADSLRKKTFKNPYGILFDRESDIIDMVSILSTVKSLSVSDQEKIWNFVKKELVHEVDPTKLESNLASVINILSKENWNTRESIEEKTSFEIDRKISHNNLDSSRMIIDDYSAHYSRLDKIYTTFDKEGANKSNSVLSIIRQEYAELKSHTSDDDLFFKIKSKVRDKVLNSSNYTSIPLEELDLCVNILVVDAFIRCKIFENPEDYNYATA